MFEGGGGGSVVIKFSAAYRALTGKDYIPNPQIYDETSTDDTREEFRKIIVLTKIGESREMLAFYLKASPAMLKFYLTAHADEWCNSRTYHPSFVYIYVNGAIDLERLAERTRAQGRFVEYYNMGRLFPNERVDRMPYFIDPAHVSDKGADVLGKF